VRKALIYMNSLFAGAPTNQGVVNSIPVSQSRITEAASTWRTAFPTRLPLKSNTQQKKPVILITGSLRYAIQAGVSDFFGYQISKAHHRRCG
jgi:hypothetical protein